MTTAALLRQHPDELAVLTSITAEHLGIDPAFVEKDFWVTEVLRAVTVEHDIADTGGNRHPVGVVFKGGTSLSRVYGITQRFSEDVDVLLAFPTATTVGARDRVLKAKCEAARAHLDIDSAACSSFDQTRGVKRSMRYTYPAAGAGSAEITTGVLLELGSRGGSEPVRQHQLRSMLATHAIDELQESPVEWEEFAAVAVTALAPERTLFEKLSHLHSAGRMAVQGDDSKLSLAGRHIYDVYRLLVDPSTIAALIDLGPNGVKALCADIDGRSLDAGWAIDPRPDGGYAGGPLYLNDPQVTSAARAAYRRSTGLIWGDVPSLDECLNKVRELQSLL